MRVRLKRFEKVVTFLGVLLDKITRYCWYISGVAITIMALVITYNVTRRYIFNQQDQYAYVTTSILMLICVVLALAYTQRQRQHLRVDLLDRYLPEKVNGIMQNIIGPIIGLICISILLLESWDSAWFSFQTGDVWGGGTVRVITWPSRMAITLGACLLDLVLIAQIIRYIASLRHKNIQEQR